MVTVEPSQGAFELAIVISSPKSKSISDNTTVKSNSLLSSLFSLKIPVPVPSSSTTAVRVNTAGIGGGILTITTPLSEPSIGISVTVID